MSPECDVSKRCREIPPFIAMDVLEKAEALEEKGQDIIHLEVGEPDFNTPPPVREAAAEALEDNRTHYTSSKGLKELREAIAEHYRQRYDVEVSPEQIIVTTGSSPAILLICSALLNQGEEIIVSDPHYPCYPNIIESAGGEAVKVPVYEEDAFQYRREDIEEKISSETKGIFVNSPSNPMGTLSTAEDLKALAELDPYVISDEIYHGLVYEGKARSILEFTDRAFVVNGFSKLYAMTGWRLGYAILPEEFVRPVQKMQQNYFICAGSFVQHAGITALQECNEYVENMVNTYDRRRRRIISGLKDLGFGIKNEPTGAFYVFADASRFGEDSYELAFDIMEEAGVAVTPGIDFGENAEGYLRFSYANSLENIEEALNRLENYL
ncbi:pyridoxal phosphate-dependent aminotransferase [Halarsenatibacter silvermanii]|uniref:Aminotransferase n=1 Tax=Halarsenatibacter silvermanii TaxID=321763 RepID=A0A1G9H7D0_9FIRM|nr:pyridoxal phosphate-dependent aminotransferase [Halarsenatibacter silvermanii]SDL08896.1 Aspartate/methionine/tyrosine aminotransferase [Halarsenatibacter silvermanii]